MQKIYLARHGQDEDNSNGILNGYRDTRLTELGQQQAQILAQTILESNLGITKIYSSPLQRAYKTAEAVADILNIAKPEKLDLLIERDFGVMTGKKVNEIEGLCSPEIIKANPIVYFLSPDGAETFPTLIERADKLLTWIKENDANENILLVTHGDIGKMIYNTFYDLDWKETLTQFHFGNSEVLLLSKDSKPEDRHVHKTAQYNH